MSSKTFLMAVFLVIFPWGILFAEPIASFSKDPNKIDKILSFQYEDVCEKMKAESQGSPLGERELGIDMSLFWQIINIVKQRHLYKEKLDMGKIVVGAVRGALQAIEPHSSFVASPEEDWYYLGEIGELGISLKKRGRYPVVRSIDEGSPAFNAGVLVGDILISVHGRSMRNVDLETARKMMEGIACSSASLVVYRKRKISKEIRFEMERATPSSYSVLGRILKNGPNSVAVIKIGMFYLDVSKYFFNVIEKIKKVPSSGMVIDLRGNSGGNIRETCLICAYFLEKEKIILSEEYPEEKAIPIFSQEYHNPFSPRLKEGTPVVCLVDEGSASAAEIMAACLRDNIGAKLVGRQTFGKGVGQNRISINRDQSLVLVTFKWLTPLGNCIDGVGLEPDFSVERGKDPKRDLQMEKALEVLSRQIEAKNYRKYVLDNPPKWE